MLGVGEIAELRRQAERAFFDTCAITRENPVDARPIDDESGQPTGAAPDPVTVYSGACAVLDKGEVVLREKGGDTDVEGEAVVKLPYYDGTVFSERPDVDLDTVSATFNGATRTGRIVRLRYLDTQVRLLVQWDTRAA